MQAVPSVDEEKPYGACILGLSQQGTFSGSRWVTGGKMEQGETMRTWCGTYGVTPYSPWRVRRVSHRDVEARSICRCNLFGSLGGGIWCGRGGRRRQATQLVGLWQRNTALVEDGENEVEQTVHVLRLGSQPSRYGCECKRARPRGARDSGWYRGHHAV